MTNPVALAYDTEGRPGTITDWAQRTTRFAYDALDRVTAMSRPGDPLTDFGYHALGRITSIEHAYGGTAVMGLALLIFRFVTCLLVHPERRVGKGS